MNCFSSAARHTSSQSVSYIPILSRVTHTTQSTKRSHTRYTTTTTTDTNHTNHSHVQYALSSVPRVARERCRPRVGPCAAQAMRTFRRIDACAAMCVCGHHASLRRWCEHEWRERCNAEWSRGGSHASRNELFFVGGSTYKLTVRVLHTHSVSCHTHDTEHEAIAHSIYDNHDYRYQPHKPRPCTAVAREAAARVLVARVLAKATICERVARWRSSDANSGGASGAARPRGCWRRRR